MGPKSFMSLRNTEHRTTLSSEVPAACSTSLILSRTRRVWVLMSWPTICPVRGSNAVCPETKTNPFALIACEYGPMACGAASVLTMSRGTTHPPQSSIKSLTMFGGASEGVLQLALGTVETCSYAGQSAGGQQCRRLWKDGGRTRG